jgi:hypothetical protein
VEDLPTAPVTSFTLSSACFTRALSLLVSYGNEIWRCSSNSRVKPASSSSHETKRLLLTSCQSIS